MHLPTVLLAALATTTSAAAVGHPLKPAEFTPSLKGKGRRLGVSHRSLDGRSNEETGHQNGKRQSFIRDSYHMSWDQNEGGDEALGDEDGSGVKKRGNRPPGFIPLDTHEKDEGDEALGNNDGPNRVNERKQEIPPDLPPSTTPPDSVSPSLIKKDDEGETLEDEDGSGGAKNKRQETPPDSPPSPPDEAPDEPLGDKGGSGAAKE